MIRRFTAAVAITVLGASFAPGQVQAQYPPAQYPPAQSSQYGQPVYTPASFGGNDHAGHDHSSGHASCPMCMMSMSGAQAGGWPTPITANYSQPSPYYREAHDDLSGDNGWDYGSSPFDAFLLGAVRGAFLRLEYLNWSYKQPGNQALGSGIAGIPEPREAFPVTVASQLAGIGRVSTIDAVDLDHRNGIRGTIGLPLPAGRGGFEASIFWMQDISELTNEREIAGNPIGGPAAGTNDVARFIVTSTFTNGVPGTNLFIYDQSFGTKFSSDLWGAEFNWVSDPYASGPGLQIRPLIGFRYLEIQEQLVQTGSFNQQGILSVPLVSVITSQSDNRTYAPQVGLRMEFVHPRFALGVEPKIGIGLNEVQNRVVTERLRSQADPTVTSTDQGDMISAVGEIALYGKLTVTEKLTVNFGYSFLFIDNVSRAHNSIFYNDNGPLADAAIVARRSTELMYYQGINLGAEFRY
jgi:hypothetical protein